MGKKPLKVDMLVIQVRKGAVLKSKIAMGFNNIIENGCGTIRFINATFEGKTYS